MTIVLISCKSYVTFRSIALKMGVLDVKNVQKHGFSPFSQFATFPYPGIVKMYLLLHFSSFLAETFRLGHKYHFALKYAGVFRNFFDRLGYALFSGSGRF